MEAVANGLDTKASRIDRRFIDNNSVIFQNNGPPMNKDIFVNYHKISSSTKRKGEGIGFAGVGAKIYLAAWSKAEIVTESGQGRDKLVSRMFRKNNKAMYESSIDGINIWTNGKHRNGTSYTVKLNTTHYKQLQENIYKILQLWFSHALLTKKITLYVDEQKVEPYSPIGTTHHKTVVYKKDEFKLHIIVCQNKVAEEMRYVTYHAYGKRVKQETIDYVAQIQEQFRDKIICMVDATPLAKHLVANKENFHANFHVNKVKVEIRKQFRKTLADIGLVMKPKGYPQSNAATESLEKTLTRALQDLNLSHLWLDAIRRGNSDVEDPGNPNSGESNNTVSDSPDNATPNPKKPRKKQKSRSRRNLGISIIMENHENDPREGWVDISNNAIVYNTGHKFSTLMEKPDELYRYNMSRVAISSLIRHHREQPEMTVDRALEYLAQLLQEVHK